MIRRIKKEMEIGTTPQEATFEGIKSLTNDEGNIKGYFISTKEYRDLWINNNLKNPEQNFELENLAAEFGLEELDDEKVVETFNAFVGKTIRVSRVTRGVYVNTHFGAPTQAVVAPEDVLTEDGDLAF